jgi:hypothetical protein
VTRCTHGFANAKLCEGCRARARVARPPLPRNLSGMTLGKLRVIRRAANAKWSWECKCTCGRTVIVRRATLHNSHQLGHVSACPDCRDYHPHEQAS